MNAVPGQGPVQGQASISHSNKKQVWLVSGGGLVGWAENSHWERRKNWDISEERGGFFAGISGLSFS